MKNRLLQPVSKVAALAAISGFLFGCVAGSVESFWLRGLVVSFWISSCFFILRFSRHPEANEGERFSQSRMGVKQLGAITIVVSIAGICCIIAATISAFYYTRYRHVRTELEERLHTLESRAEWLQGHLSFHDDIPFRLQGSVETTLNAESSPVRQTLNAVDTKEGPMVYGKFYLLVGSGERREFDIRFDQRRFGNVIDAWVMRTEPADVSAFEEFRVCPPVSMNVVRLVVQAKTNAPVGFKFTLGVLRMFD